MASCVTISKLGQKVTLQGIEPGSLLIKASKGKSEWAGLIYMAASKGLGWAGGSHFEFEEEK
jgi:hypothetical protein